MCYQNIMFCKTENFVAGRLHQLVVTLPLKNITFQGWHRMVEYFMQAHRIEPSEFAYIERSYQDAINKAFDGAISSVLDPRLCDSCTNAYVNSNTKLFFSRLVRIR